MVVMGTGTHGTGVFNRKFTNFLVSRKLLFRRSSQLGDHFTQFLGHPVRALDQGVHGFLPGAFTMDRFKICNPGVFFIVLAVLVKALHGNHIPSIAGVELALVNGH
jgi:hypothetical protein